MHELLRTINYFKRLGTRDFLLGILMTKVASLQNKLVGFTSSMIDKGKMICSNFITVKELYLIASYSRLKPIIHWAEEWKTVMKK